jgi:hypothetical protein
MTALDAAADGTRHPRAHSEDAAAGQAAAAGPLAGGPTALGLPSFTVDAVALGQVLAGVAANCSRTHLPDEVRPPVTVGDPRSAAGRYLLITTLSALCFPASAKVS